MKKRVLKKIFISAVCLMLVLCSTVLCGCNNTEEQQTEAPTEAPVLVKAVRVKESMTAGSSIAVKDIELVDAYSNELPEGYFAKTTEATGRRLAVDVVAGQYLAESLLEAKADTSTSDDDNNITESVARESGYVVITDYVNAIGGVDVSEEIQKVIDENPNSTIYFPDGTYTIANPILTSSDPAKAVSLCMSNFAIIKAAHDWQHADLHMIRLGAKDKSFDIDNVGSNYYFHGGMIDGSYVAKGLSIEGGRETSVRYISMKNVTQGVHIMYNEQCPSSNVDLQTVNIVGCYEKDSIGVLVDGYDNTLTNMRVASFQVAIKLNGARNTLRNLHMLWRYNDGKYSYEDSVGFWDTSEGNTYDICYPDNFAIGFLMSESTVSVYNNCYAYWYTNRYKEALENGNPIPPETQIGFMSEGKFNSIIKHCRVDLKNEMVGKYLVVGESGGTGIVEYPIFPIAYNEDNAYIDYLKGTTVIWH